MPKLSQQTLEKRFSCPHCGQKIRTRQGLSGHIQFKHKSGTLEEGNNYVQVFLDASQLQRRAGLAGFNNKDIGEMKQIVAFWEFIKALVENEHITFNNTDYKNYLILSLTLMQTNKRLHQALTTDLSEGMAVGFTRLASMITATEKES